MDDIEARREARRRRILQSSEDRINRVLGQTVQKPGEQLTAEKVPRDDTNLSQNASAGEQSGIRNRKQLAADDNGSPRKKWEEDNKNHPAASTVKISPLKKPQTAMENNSQVNTADSINTSRSTCEAKMMLKHFEFLRIVLCFIVAFLCRRVLATGYGIFYVQTVIIPFACMESGFFMFKHKFLHNVILPHRSSMLVGLLMLCGLKPGVVQLYNKTMGYITAASEDLALFFFAFMMAHVFLV